MATLSLAAGHLAGHRGIHPLHHVLDALRAIGQGLAHLLAAAVRLVERDHRCGVRHDRATGRIAVTSPPPVRAAMRSSDARYAASSPSGCATTVVPTEHRVPREQGMVRREGEGQGVRGVPGGGHHPQLEPADADDVTVAEVVMAAPHRPYRCPGQLGEAPC